MEVTIGEYGSTVEVSGGADINIDGIGDGTTAVGSRMVPAPGPGPIDVSVPIRNPDPDSGRTEDHCILDIPENSEANDVDVDNENAAVRSATNTYTNNANADLHAEYSDDDVFDDMLQDILRHDGGRSIRSISVSYNYRSVPSHGGAYGNEANSNITDAADRVGVNGDEEPRPNPIIMPGDGPGPGPPIPMLQPGPAARVDVVFSENEILGQRPQQQVRTMYKSNLCGIAYAIPRFAACVLVLIYSWNRYICSK